MENFMDKLHSQMTAIKNKTDQLINESRKDGTLIYFKDASCKEDELIKLEHNKESKIKLDIISKDERTT